MHPSSASVKARTLEDPDRVVNRPRRFRACAAPIGPSTLGEAPGERPGVPTGRRPPIEHSRRQSARGFDESDGEKQRRRTRGHGHCPGPRR